MTDKTLIVLLEGQRIGVLQENAAGKHSFIYDKHAPGQLSLSLPRRSEPWTGNPVEAYIDGVLPDNPEMRRTIGRLHGVNGNNPFALLTVIGLDCAGGAQFVLPEQLESVENSEYSLTPISEEEIEKRLKAITDTHQASWQVSDEHWSLNGAQDKIALHHIDEIWYEAKGAAPTTHIIKPGIHTLHEQAFNEYICLKTLNEMGIPVAQTSFKTFGSTPALVSARWDRRVVDRNGRSVVARSHQEVFGQATAHPTANKYQSEGGPSAQDIIQCMRANGLDETEIKLFYMALVINFLIAGTDAHAKNYALLEPVGEKPTFAPLYDIASMFAYQTQRKQRKLAMSIGGEYNYERIELKHWEKLTAPFGADDWEFCRSALKALSQTLPFAFIVTAQNCLQEISSFDPSPETRSNRGMLIRHIANGIIGQCRRVEAWFE